MFGSLRRKARSKVKHHISTNPELRALQPGFFGRIENKLFKGRGLFYFISIYFIFASILALLYFFLQIFYPELVECYFISLKYNESISVGINKVFLAVQATLIGIIFPIVVALVTLLLQQRGTFSSSRVDVYYIESRAFEVAASSIGLIIVLIITLLVQQSQLVLESYGISSDVATMLLKVSFIPNGVWFLLNVLALWQFLVVSFTFIRPIGQRHILRRHVVRESFPRGLEDSLARHPSTSYGGSAIRRFKKMLVRLWSVFRRGEE